MPEIESKQSAQIELPGTRYPVPDTRTPVEGIPPKDASRARKVIASWATYDFANSSFSGIMISFVFPIYFRNVIVTDGHGDKYFGYTTSLSMLLVVLVAPMLGAIADILHNKKLFLGLFTAVTVCCTTALYFIQPGMVFTAAFLFILANAGFEGGLVFYDAFLPEITTESNYGRVSGYGYALGYLGSLAILILCFPFLDSNPRLTFLITAIFFFIFAWPIFLFVPERPIKKSVSPIKLAVDGFRKVIVTMQHIREYKNVARFLLAFFIYNDAVLTVILFAGIYASSTLHFTMTELAMFFAMIQVVAVAGSLIFGRISDRKGSRYAIIITLFIWSGIVIAAFFTDTKATFFVIGGIAGIALGSSQSCSRSLMALLTPVERKTEFFGFYEGFCGKASAIIGPLIFGFLADSIGQRYAILALIVFFIAGLILISTVKEERAENMPRVA